MAFNHFFSVMLLVVSTLFNAVPLDPVSRVKSAVCGSGYIVLSPQLESFCSTLDVLRLPAAPPVLTIDAPPFRLDLGLIQINTSHGSSPTLTSTGRQTLEYARRASTARRFSSSDPTSVDFDWTELYWMCVLFVLLLAANAYMLRYHFDSIVRGLTWFFCGPPPRRPHVPQPAVYYQEVQHGSTPTRQRDDDPFWYISELALPAEQEEQEDVAELNAHVPTPPASEPPVDDAPTNLAVADAVLEAPEEEGPEPQERKRVRSAARCQRVRQQKTQAREHDQEQQQAVAGPSSAPPDLDKAENPEPQAENMDKERWGARGGKKVRRRQKAFERKLAARAAAKTEPEPPSAPPVFNDENFPPLAGPACKPKLPQVKMSYALVTAVAPPSPSALIRHAGPYTVRANQAADLERPQPEDKGRAVYYSIEELSESGSWDELMRLDRMATGSSRKGKRRKKGHG